MSHLLIIEFCNKYILPFFGSVYPRERQWNICHLQHFYFGPLIGFSWNIPLFAFVSSFPFSRALLSYVGSVCFWIWAREAVSPIFVFDITVTFHFCILALNFSGTTPWIVYLWTLVTLNTFVGPTKHRRHPAGKSPNINVGLVGQRIAQRQHVGCSVHFVLSEA